MLTTQDLLWQLRRDRMLAHDKPYHFGNSLSFEAWEVLRAALNVYREKVLRNAELSISQMAKADQLAVYDLAIETLTQDFAKNDNNKPLDLKTKK